LAAEPAPAERGTERSLAKASRRAALLKAAAQLFAERGYNGVSMEDLGGTVGVSGPAVYRHFSSKQAVLAALLVDASAGLLAGGREVVAATADPEAALRRLVRFHVDFALLNAAVIRVQDRDLDSLSDDDRRTVRVLQRRYVEVWVDTLARLRPQDEAVALRNRAHAVFGLINSTPHAAAAARGTAGLRTLLERMAWAALNA
jgi:AcrR family transcriptional regulator